MKNYLFISNEIDKIDILIASFNENTIYKIDNYVNLDDIQECDNLAFLYHSNDFFPFYDDNDKEPNPNYDASNYFNNITPKFWDKIKSLGCNVDLITCNIIEDYKISNINDVFQEYGICIRYSLDETGNYNSGGDWILENSTCNEKNVDIKYLYFNDNIENWDVVLAIAVTFAITNVTTNSIAIQITYSGTTLSVTEQGVYTTPYTYLSGVSGATTNPSTLVGSTTTKQLNGINYSTITVNGLLPGMNYTVQAYIISGSSTYKSVYNTQTLYNAWTLFTSSLTRTESYPYNTYNNFGLVANINVYPTTIGTYIGNLSPGFCFSTNKSILENTSTGRDASISIGYASFSDSGVTGPTGARTCYSIFPSGSSLILGNTYYIRFFYFANNPSGSTYYLIKSPSITDTDFKANLSSTTYVLPTVENLVFSNITKESVQILIKTNSPYTSIKYGLCYSKTSQYPKVGNADTTNVFTSADVTTVNTTYTLPSLQPYQIYFTSVYLIYASNYFYGAVSSFTTLPSITTLSVSNVSNITATVNYKINCTLSASIESGVCYATHSAPLYTEQKQSSLTTIVGEITLTNTLLSLSSGVTYYVRSFVKIGVSIYYGEELSFVTLHTPYIEMNPTVTILNGTETINTTGVITANGNSTVTEAGFIWGLDNDIDISKPYYIKNIDNTIYGRNGLTSFVPNSSNYVEFTLPFNITYNNTSYSKAYLSKTSSHMYFQQFGVGPSISITNSLIDQMKYPDMTLLNCHYGIISINNKRAFIIKCDYRFYQTDIVKITRYLELEYTFYEDINYRIDISFDHGTDYVNWINLYGYNSSNNLVTMLTFGNLLFNKGIMITPIFKTSQTNPTNNSVQTSISNINHQYTYYLKFYATNAIGTVYSNTVEFFANSVPDVSSDMSVSSITSTKATFGGMIYHSYGSSLSEKGICWATHNNPSIKDYKAISNNTNIDNVFLILSNLLVNTTYYVRVYAINKSGIGYGNVVQFKTSKFDSGDKSIIFSGVNNVQKQKNIGCVRLTSNIIDNTNNVRDIKYYYHLSEPSSQTVIMEGSVSKYKYTFNINCDNLIPGLTYYATYKIKNISSDGEETEYKDSNNVNIPITNTSSTFFAITPSDVISGTEGRDFLNTYKGMLINLSNKTIKNIDLKNIDLSRAILIDVKCEGGLTYNEETVLPINYKIIEGYLFGPHVNISSATKIKFSDAIIEGIDITNMKFNENVILENAKFRNIYSYGNPIGSGVSHVFGGIVVANSVNLNGMDLRDLSLSTVQENHFMNVAANNIQININTKLPTNFKFVGSDTNGYCIVGKYMNLSNANLSNVYMENINLSGANLMNVNFYNSISKNITIDSTTKGVVVKDGHIIAKGVNLSSEYNLFSNYTFENLDMTDINLFGHDLSKAVFRNVNLTGIKVSQNKISDSTIFENIICNGNVSHSNLTFQSGNKLITNGFILTKTSNLTNTNLNNVYIHDIDLSNVTIKNTKLPDIHPLYFVTVSGASVAVTSVTLPAGYKTQLFKSSAYMETLYVIGNNLDCRHYSIKGYYNSDTDKSTNVLPKVENCNFQGVDLAYVDLSDNIINANFLNCKFKNCTYKSSNVATGFLIININGEPTLIGKGADLRNVNLCSIDLSKLDLTGCRVGNNRHNDNTKLPLNYTWLDDNIIGEGVILDYLEVTDYDISNVNLKGMKLNGIRSSNVTNSKLDNLPSNSAVVKGFIICPNANLSGCDLSNAYLSNLDISGINFTGANLRNVKSDGLFFSTPPIFDLENGNSKYTLINGHLLGSNVDLSNMLLTNVSFKNVDNNGHDFSFAGCMTKDVIYNEYTVNNLPAGYTIIKNINKSTDTKNVGTIVGPYICLYDVDFSGYDLHNFIGKHISQFSVEEKNQHTCSLYRVRSRNIKIDNNTILPNDFDIINGYLVGAGVDLTGCDLSYSKISYINLEDALIGCYIYSYNPSFNITTHSKITEFTGSTINYISGRPTVYTDNEIKEYDEYMAVSRFAIKYYKNTIVVHGSVLDDINLSSYRECNVGDGFYNSPYPSLYFNNRIKSVTFDEGREYASGLTKYNNMYFGTFLNIKGSDAQGTFTNLTFDSITLPNCVNCDFSNSTFINCSFSSMQGCLFKNTKFTDCSFILPSVFDDEYTIIQSLNVSGDAMIPTNIIGQNIRLENVTLGPSFYNFTRSWRKDVNLKNVPLDNMKNVSTSGITLDYTLNEADYLPQGYTLLKDPQISSQTSWTNCYIVGPNMNLTNINFQTIKTRLGISCLNNLDLSGCDFTDCNLDGFELIGTNFKNCIFNRTTFGTYTNSENLISLNSHKTLKYIEIPYVISNLPTSNISPTSEGIQSRYWTNTYYGGYWNLSLPFTIKYFGTSYSNIYVSMHSFIAFDVSTTISQVNTNATNYIESVGSIYSLSSPRIMLCGADTFNGRLIKYTQFNTITSGNVGDRKYTMRYAGNGYDVAGGRYPQNNVSWEVTFYEKYPSRIDIIKDITSNISPTTATFYNGVDTSTYTTQTMSVEYLDNLNYVSSSVDVNPSISSAQLYEPIIPANVSITSDINSTDYEVVESSFLSGYEGWKAFNKNNPYNLWSSGWHGGISVSRYNSSDGKPDGSANTSTVATNGVTYKGEWVQLRRKADKLPVLSEFDIYVTTANYIDSDPGLITYKFRHPKKVIILGTNNPSDPSPTWELVYDSYASLNQLITYANNETEKTTSNIEKLHPTNTNRYYALRFIINEMSPGADYPFISEIVYKTSVYTEPVARNAFDSDLTTFWKSQGGYDSKGYALTNLTNYTIVENKRIYGEWIEVQNVTSYFLNLGKIVLTVDKSDNYPLHIQLVGSYDRNNWKHIYSTSTALNYINDTATVFLDITKKYSYIRLIIIKTSINNSNSNHIKITNIQYFKHNFNSSYKIIENEVLGRGLKINTPHKMNQISNNEIDLSYCVLENVDVSGINFTNCILTGIISENIFWSSVKPTFPENFDIINNFILGPEVKLNYNLSSVQNTATTYYGAKQTFTIL